jgi:hypothetical protein
MGLSKSLLQNEIAPQDSSGFPRVSLIMQRALISVECEPLPTEVSGVEPTLFDAVPKPWGYFRVVADQRGHSISPQGKTSFS